MPKRKEKKRQQKLDQVMGPIYSRIPINWGQRCAFFFTNVHRVKYKKNDRVHFLLRNKGITIVGG